ncbi:ankyrin [Piromyces finnis]|uniref:Ankyrin n=1 Tax=Piromyces finnis TaxID=1754191 RepID=A0A1Y1V858_9FUNG|nr:ankyrin [Piromyces finnis]|eukprot:ORX49619.1 ankyrin [Piromyces finnis]
MGFEQLDLRILIDLKNNNTKECFYIIKNNKEIIKKYLGENANPEIVRSYVKKLNYVILNTSPPLDFIEEMLNLPYFSRVYSVFLQSNILIEACKLGKKEILDWLLTLNINHHVRDSKGRTALMHASKNPDLLYVVKKLSYSGRQNIINYNTYNSHEPAIHTTFNYKNNPSIYNNKINNKNYNSNLTIGNTNNNNNNNNNSNIIDENTNKEIIDTDEKDSNSLKDEDDQGRNALFYAIRNITTLKELLKTEINVNHLNKKHETVLLYCCKNNIFEPIQYLTQHSDLDVNLTDKREWTAAMYLAEKGRKEELMNLNQHNHECNYEYQNTKYESALSIIMKKMYWPEEEIKKKEEEEEGEDDKFYRLSNISFDSFGDYASSIYSEPLSFYRYSSSHSNHRDSMVSFYNKPVSSAFYLPYILILTRFIHMGFNFNLPMDKDGNTPLMILIIVKDIHTLHYVLNTSKNYDLSVKNKYGENACTLALKYKLPRGILDVMKNHPTFDYNYYDQATGNNLFLLSAMTEPMLMQEIIRKDPEIIHSVNPHGKENALILATKLHHQDSVNVLLQLSIPIDFQDALGNTALSYAINSNDIHIVKILRDHNANMNIKNKDGLSPLDYAQSLGYHYMLDILNKNRNSILYSFPSLNTNPKLTQKFDTNSSLLNKKYDKENITPNQRNPKREYHLKKASKIKNKNEEVKDFYFQFLEKEEDSKVDDKEVNNYIQPRVGPYYFELDMDLPYELILAEQKIYNDEVYHSRTLLRQYTRHDSSTASYDTDYDYFVNSNSIPVI